MGMEHVRLLVKCLGRNNLQIIMQVVEKKQNKKRQATSPLCENSSPDLNTSMVYLLGQKFLFRSDMNYFRSDVN